MQLAFSTNAFTRFSLDDALNHIAAAGFSSVEILADKPHWYPGDFVLADAEKIRTRLAELKLGISNINANCTFGYFSDAPPEAFFEPSLVSPLPKYRLDRVAMILNTLRFAHALGAGNISITSGKALPTMPPAKALAQLHESLKPILELAHKLNIRIGFECEPGLLIEWATELKDLCDDLKSPLLGANLDLGHSVVMGEDPAQVIHLLAGRIWNCHVEDLLGRKHYHLIPGQGNMNWQSIFDALRATHYNRGVTVELYSYPDAPVDAAKESYQFLRTFF